MKASQATDDWRHFSWVPVARGEAGREEGRGIRIREAVRYVHAGAAANDGG